MPATFLSPPPLSAVSMVVPPMGDLPQHTMADALSVEMCGKTVWEPSSLVRILLHQSVNGLNYVFLKLHQESAGKYNYLRRKVPSH